MWLQATILRTYVVWYNWLQTKHMGMIFGLFCPKLDAPTYIYVDERMTNKRWTFGDLKTGTTTNDTYHLLWRSWVWVSVKQMQEMIGDGLDGLDYYSQYMDIHKIPWFQTTGPSDKRCFR